MSDSVPLTAHLAALSTPRPYAAATEHAFLTAAGTGTLPPALLSLYLAQDRRYAAHAYPRFLGQLLARVPLPLPSSPAPSAYSSTTTTTAAAAAADGQHAARVGVLADALQNVRREVGLFGAVDGAHGLRLARWRERKATRDYAAEMARVGALGTFEDGLVFLWAMERVYLDAWTYVRSLLPNAASAGVEAGSGSSLPAVRQLVENWTNPEFVKFVDTLADLVNELDITPGSDAFIRAEEIWARVVELEEAFWPVGGEELALLSSE
ncbi:heme oxygenase-like protein [Trametes elegans]|nr:heme oxygenase-like protein [Trametes elegans]